MTDWHSLNLEETYEKLGSSAQGLTQETAVQRLEEFGENKLPSKKKTSPITLFVNQFKNFLVIILIFAAIVSYFVGSIPGYEDHFIDAVLIFLILIANAFFGFMQDYKAEKSIEALKRMSMPFALVLRNGIEEKIAVSQLVPGDVVLLKEGDRIPADVRLIEIINLTVDESALTGESIPSSKEVKEYHQDTVLAERKNMAHMHTNVVRGKAKAIVVDTGLETSIGKIAAELLKEEDKETLFDIEIKHLAKNIGLGILLIVVAVALTEIILHQGDPLTIFLIAISLAVAAIPEGLPAVVTLALAIGVSRMAKQKALIRRMSTVESLGSIDVICTDKTGTLTENIMTVKSIYANQKYYSISGTGWDLEGTVATDKLLNEELGKDELTELLRCGFLCNDSKRQSTTKTQFLGDPTEIALLIPAYKLGLNVEKERMAAKREYEVSFSSDRKMMSTINTVGSKQVVYSKGAAEVLLDHCTHIQESGKTRKLTTADKQNILEKNKEMASQALRVLAFATKEHQGKFTDEGVESNLIFLGLMGMIDPPRVGVREAISDCRTAGIRVVMITGDNGVTAQAIGKELDFGASVLSGNELDKLDEDELKKLVETTSIFARATPEHKVRILRALKSNGHLVAMTGDGVNDAPALKSSHVGISMGIRGTDVAKETSDMILLDDNFVTIRNAIEQGRGIFENIRKFVAYLLAGNSAEVLVVFSASLLALGLPLTAVQLLWINLLTDGLPALALGVDPIPKDVMKRPPKRANTKIIDKRMIYLILSLGIIATVIILYIFQQYLPDLVKAQTMVFTTLVVIEMVKVFMVRGYYHTKELSNKWLFAAVGTSFALQLIVLYTPLAGFFKLVPLTLADWGLIGTGLIVFVILASVALKIEEHFLQKKEQLSYN